MLSRKNKDTRTIKEGVVGKYVKKDKPPEIPSKYLIFMFIVMIHDTIVSH